MVSLNFAVVAGSCRFLPGPTGCRGFGPQSLRAPAFSTLGFPHDRWSLELGSPRPRRSPPTPRTAPPGPPRLGTKTPIFHPRHRGRLPQGRRDWTNQPVYKARAASPPSRPAMGSRSSPITYLFSLAVIGSSGADPLDKMPTVRRPPPPTTPALPDPMTLPIRPRARLLQGRHVGSDHSRGPVTPRTSPRFTTAHSGCPPGPSAGSSARGCSARGTNGATDPGSLK